MGCGRMSLLVKLPIAWPHSETLPVILVLTPTFTKALA